LRRRLLIVGAVAVVIAIVASLTVTGLLTGGGHTSSSPSTAAPGAATAPTGAATTTAGPPRAADVAAARACEAFEVYLQDAKAGHIPAAAGRRLVTTTGVLLRGTRADQKAGRTLPEWAELASNILASANDIVGHNDKALATAGAAADRSCQEIPAAAAAAGGYARAK
jgi:hypothetical protein